MRRLDDVFALALRVAAEARPHQRDAVAGIRVAFVVRLAAPRVRQPRGRVAPARADLVGVRRGSLGRPRLLRRRGVLVAAAHHLRGEPAFFLPWTTMRSRFDAGAGQARAPTRGASPRTRRAPRTSAADARGNRGITGHPTTTLIASQMLRESRRRRRVTPRRRWIAKTRTVDSNLESSMRARGGVRRGTTAGPAPTELFLKATDDLGIIAVGRETTCASRRVSTSLRRAGRGPRSQEKRPSRRRHG